MTTNELEIWRALNELPEVKKVFIKTHGFILYDFMFCIQANRAMDRTECLHCDMECESIVNALWIPPLYDPIRPERSLWGMSEDIRHRWGSQFEEACFLNTARPDLTLAKAILEGKEKE